MERMLGYAGLLAVPHGTSGNARGWAEAGEPDPFGPKKIFNYSERTGVLPHRDTVLCSPGDHLTFVSPSGPGKDRRRLAAYPAVQSASPAMIAVSTANAPVWPTSAPSPSTR